MKILRIPCSCNDGGCGLAAEMRIWPGPDTALCDLGIGPLVPNPLLTVRTEPKSITSLIDALLFVAEESGKDGWTTLNVNPEKPPQVFINVADFIAHGQYHLPIINEISRGKHYHCGCGECTNELNLKPGTKPGTVWLDGHTEDGRALSALIQTQRLLGIVEEKLIECSETDDEIELEFIEQQNMIGDLFTIYLGGRELRQQLLLIQESA